MHGLHLTADLRDCPVDRPSMTDPAALRRLCLAAIEAAGLHAVAELFHRFAAAGRCDAEANGPAPAASGITGVVLLAESHLAVHTWPEEGAVTIDAHVCNRGGDNSRCAEALMTALIDAFSPGRVERHALVRGAQLLVDSKPSGPDAITP